MSFAKSENGRVSLSMTTKMLINAVEAEELRVAIIKDGLLDGFHIGTSTTEEKIGNIYKGVVERVQASLQACFVNFGGEKNGFLHIFGNSGLNPQ